MGGMADPLSVFDSTSTQVTYLWAAPRSLYVNPWAGTVFSTARSAYSILPTSGFQ
jgi:hypothetical protein